MSGGAELLALSCYLDASFLVALLTPEPLTARALDFVARYPSSLVQSDFGRAEFSSAISRRVRTGEMHIERPREHVQNLETWSRQATRLVWMEREDVALATEFLNRLNLPLRTPDAIHIAIARRLRAALVTFDRVMAGNARTLGTAVMTP